MKNPIEILDRVTTVLLMAVCLFSMAVPAAAADPTTVSEDIRYGIAIECSYSDIEDSDTADRSIYEENIFLLSSKASELYAIAEYSEEKQTYVVSDYTADRDNATQFRCGTNGKLLISNLAQDTYILEHIDTLSGYITIVETEIVFSSTGITVDNRIQNAHTDFNTGDHTASLSIVLMKGFDLPMSECGLICWSYRNFGFDIFSTVGCVLIIGCSIALFFVIRSARKKPPTKQT